MLHSDDGVAEKCGRHFGTTAFRGISGISGQSGVSPLRPAREMKEKTLLGVNLANPFRIEVEDFGTSTSCTLLRQRKFSRHFGGDGGSCQTSPLRA